ncbi:MAG: hypothetical protein JXA94_04935 [Parachlamydiales bacterium]|nr:hypothetical protein [Parachlamydiales bacterium]
MAFFADFFRSVVDSDHAYLPYGEIDTEKTAAIDKLINNLAVDSFKELISYSFEDVALGKKIIEVHPFMTWQYILNNSELKTQLVKINRNSGWGFNFLKTQSLIGFAEALKKRHERKSADYPDGELLPYLEEFAKNVTIPLVDLQKFVDTKDWQGFINRILPK